MTKKDYILLANVIKQAHEVSRLHNDDPHIDALILARMMGVALKNQNPLFDMDKFLKACKP